jgi:uncharacterized GH25 family protein
MCGVKPTPDTLPAGIDPGKESIIQGTISRNGDPVGGAFVRLLDESGEFTAEVVASDNGVFRFFARPGKWTVRALAAGGTGDANVAAEAGEVTSVELRLSD